MFNRFDRILDFNPLIAPLTIIVIVFAVYMFSISNAFVLDDLSQVGGNPNVISFNLPGLFFGSTFGVAGSSNAEGIYYKPLMTSSYALIYKLFGGGSAAFHQFQVLLHIINAILIFYVFKRFFSPKISLFLAIIFGIHPFNSESVLYISALQEPLFFLFGAAGFIFATKKHMSKSDYILAAVLMFLSLLSKETGILFLASSVLYRLMFIKEKSSLYRVLESYVPVFIIYGLLRFSAVGIIPSFSDAPYPIMRLSLQQRLINVPSEALYYLRNFFAPYDFAVGQHWTVSHLSFGDFYLPFALCALFLFVLFMIFQYLFRVKSRYLLVLAFFSGWFILGLFTHLNIVPLDATVADRWFYFPVVGLLGIIGVSLSVIKVKNMERYRNLIIYGALVLILILSARTLVRTFDWRTGLSLDSRDIKFAKNSFPLENNYGFELINAGRYDEAEVHLKRSVKLGPWWWLNWNNLGVVYRHKGYTKDPKYYKQAEEYFLKSVNNTSVFYLPYENLAELLFNYDTPQKTQAFIVDVSKRKALSGRLWFYLALTQLRLKDRQGALQAVNQARLALPNDAQISALYNAIVNNKTVQVQKPVY